MKAPPVCILRDKSGRYSPEDVMADWSWVMIRVCYYKGCGTIYGEKEPLSDDTVTHGLCPKHLKRAQAEFRAELEKLEHMGILRLSGRRKK
jgi:hypothetical protein